MKKANVWFLLTIFSLSVNSIFAKESVEKLLEGYLKNNLTLINLSAEVEKQNLQTKSDLISNGMNIKLSTGNISFSYKDGAELKFTPTASVSIPQADNLSFSVSSNFNLEDNSSSFSNTSLSVSADIYSGAMAQRKISLDKSRRNFLESQRALQNGFLNAETEFYKSLKNLYEIGLSVQTAENDLYSDSLSFDQIRAQGYSSSSSKYRLAQMKVLSDKHKVEQYEHQLKREVSIFASKCGVAFTDENVWEFLPEEIPSVTLLNIRDFNKSDFTKIESAVWKHEINERSRLAEKKFSMSANAGYTFKNELKSDEFSDTIDAGTSFTLNGSGLTANLGVSLPVSNLNPVYKLGISVVPNQFRLSSLNDKQKSLTSEQEKLSIQSAENEYETAVISQRNKLRDLVFNKNKIEETYDLYESLEKDMKQYFENGLIKESEYKSALVNKENYRVQRLVNDIEMIIYNNETKLFFNRDEEIEK